MVQEGSCTPEPGDGVGDHIGWARATLSLDGLEDMPVGLYGRSLDHSRNRCVDSGLEPEA